MKLSMSDHNIVQLMKDRIDAVNDADEICRFAEGILGVGSDCISYDAETEQYELTTSESLEYFGIDPEDVTKYHITVED